MTLVASEFACLRLLALVFQARDSTHNLALTKPCLAAFRKLKAVASEFESSNGCLGAEIAVIGPFVRSIQAMMRLDLIGWLFK